MKKQNYRVWDYHNNNYAENFDLEDIGMVLAGMDTLEAEQSTGKLDIDGKEIFEGDIVEYTEKVEHGDAHGPFIGVIKYCDGLCAYGAADTKQGDVMAYFFELVYTGWKVIGNIHENPDLIK